MIKLDKKFTVEQAKRIEPSLEDLTDEEIKQIIVDIFELAELALECYKQDKKQSPKIPSGLLLKEQKIS